jgi:N-acetylmuramoyl-L-alanine amidase
MRRITHLVVHNNGVAGRTIEDIRRTHKSEGWADVGYHFVYHEDGSEHVGRKISRPGAHVAAFNARTVGLCVIGNGDERDFNEKQYQALIKRLVVLCKEFKLSADRVIGHRETVPLVPRGKGTKKSCPGTKVDMDRLRSMVAAALASP